MPANLENSVVATGPEKSVFIPIPKKGNAKECSNYCTIALISYTSKVMLKILQARLQQYMNCEHPDTQAGWGQFPFPVPKKGNAKECSNYHTIGLISHASKVMLKILQARLQRYMNCEHPNTQAGFRKGRGTRDQIANMHWIIKKAREFQRNIYFCFIDYVKGFDCVGHNKL